MAASEPPSLETPSRRLKKSVTPSALQETPPDSRAERSRQRRERSLERQFSWLFVVAVGATTLYLISRTPWGLTFLHTHF